MKFLADLHIHSRFSLATSKNTDVENLYVAARKKGITVLGTGGFTQPACWNDSGRSFISLISRAKDELRNSGIPLLAEAMERMRKNEVMITPGFDGKYGTVKLFKKDESKGLKILRNGLSGIWAVL